MKRWIVGISFVLSVGITFCLGQPNAGAGQYATDDAWRAFSKGRKLLESTAPRSAVLAQWREGLRLNSQHPLAPQVAKCIPILERQVEEDKTLAKETVAQPEKLPLPRRIDYYIKRFVEVHGMQSGQPGTCHTVGYNIWAEGDEPSHKITVEPATRFSDSIVLIGRPAIPALIRHLNDTRLTRSVAFRNGYWYVLRVQDVAVECISCITHCPFFFERASVDYLSMGPAERTHKVNQEITDWWHRNKNRSALHGYMD